MNQNERVKILTEIRLQVTNIKHSSEFKIIAIIQQKERKNKKKKKIIT